jgi:hypothetical protein
MKISQQIRRLLFIIFACLLHPCVASAASITLLDIFVVYDKTSENYFKSEVSTAMENWISQLNTINANSGADIRWRLVGVAPANIQRNEKYFISEEYPDYVLSHLAANDEVKSLRQKAGADFVVYLTSLSDSNICGNAYSFATGDMAYSLVDPTCGPIAMAHELGHNMGLQHSRLDGNESGTLFRYGLGYVVEGKFGDIMSYVLNHRAVKIAKYSNPRQTQNGEPFGVTAGLPNEADAVLAINNGKERFAAFRPSKNGMEYLDSITQRTKLASGDSLRSLNRKYVVKMQVDGNLVLYNDQTGRAIWWSGTQAYPGAYAILQADGHFSVYDATGIWRWGSWTSYSGINARLTVGDDGNMRIVQPETYWWNSNTQVSSYAAPSTPVGQSLWPVGTYLTPGGGALQSANGETKLAMQADGDLWLSRKGVVIWHSGTSGNANAYAKMQEDGNMVIYAKAFDQGALWNSGTWGHPGASMLVQDDGNMVIYTWKSIWATNTAGQ